MVSVSTLWPSALLCTKEMDSSWSQESPQAGQHMNCVSNRKGLVRERSCGWGKQGDFTSVHNMKNAVLNFGFYCSKSYNLKLAVILWKGCSPARLWHGRKGWTFFSYSKDCREIAVLEEVCPKANCDYLVPLRTNVPMPGKETLE